MNRAHDANGKDSEAKSEDSALGVAQSSDAPLVHAEEASVQGREEPTVESANNDGADQEDAGVDLAELRRMRKMKTRDLLRSEPGMNVRRFCARSRVHDLCEIVVLEEHDTVISGTATDILLGLRKGPLTPAQEAYLDGVLAHRQMHDRVPAEESAKDLVAGLGKNLVHDKYGHVEVWDVRDCTTLEEAFEDVTKIKGRLDLTFWDTRKVESMSRAFRATSFDVDVSTWDVSAVTSMSLMFTRATAF
jgi:hypothetical protein